MKFEDFKPVKDHEGYLIRDLGDNGTGSGQWAELNRVDGWGLGAMPVEQVEQAIKNDKAPPTGKTLEAIFGPPNLEKKEDKEETEDKDV